MLYAVFYCKKNGEDKEKINAMVDELRGRGFAKVFFSSFFALLTPVIILGCIYSGVTSPTEAAVISVFYAPILLPIMESFGVDPVHFGIIMVVNLAIGFVTPPIGVNLFVAGRG